MINFYCTNFKVVFAKKSLTALSCLLLLNGCIQQSGWQSKINQSDNITTPENLAEVNRQHNNTDAKDLSTTVVIPAETAAFKPLPQEQKTKNTAVYIPTGGDIVLRFANTPIATVVDLILTDYLGIAYEIETGLTGNINFTSDDGLSENDLIPVLETLLTSINARLIPNGSSYQIKKGPSRRSSASSGSMAIIPLEFIGSAEFLKVLQSASIPSTEIARSNLVLVTGAKSKINQARALAKSFDLNWLQGMAVGIYEVRNTSATELRKELLSMLNGDSKSSQVSAARIIALERTNSVMIIATSNTLINQLGRWVKRLDQVGLNTNSDFYIYRVQNGKATDLAKLVNDMFASHQHNPPIGDSSQKQNADFLRQAQSPSNNFRVIADESTNSLIVTGSPHYFNKVRKAMKELDSSPMQVLVEARIMELTLSDELEYGLEWFLNGSRANTQTSGTLDFGSVGINVPVPGFNYLVERAGEVRAAVNALADDSRLKVLSSPSLMVLNNQTANIRVGDEVPIPTRQAISTISPDAPTVNEIEYRNTGILLTVTPRVNSSGMVTMDISQEVSSVTSNSVSQIDAPTIQQRQINSTISVQSGQTVVLGGLIRERQFDQDAGIPLLKQLPGLGKLFSTNANKLQRTELVALITPRVILTQQDAAIITQEFQQKMIGLQPLSLQQL